MGRSKYVRYASIKAHLRVARTTRRKSACTAGPFVSRIRRITLARMIPLSILDLSVVTTGTRPAAALRNSIDLARHADGLGYVRYWLAEHHNLSAVAGPPPRLMIGQIAAG